MDLYIRKRINKYIKKIIKLALNIKSLKKNMSKKQDPNNSKDLLLKDEENPGNFKVLVIIS